MRHIIRFMGTRFWIRAWMVIAVGCCAVTAQAANLLEVYQQAASSDPLIREADANRLASREAKPQAWAALLPQASASVGWGVAKTGADGVSAAITRGGAYGISVTESVNIPASLLSLKRADYLVAQAELGYRLAQQNLVVRVAQRYFDVLAARDALDSAQASLAAFNRQLDQAEKRFEVGLSAITDVQEARASRDAANATVIAAKRTLSTNQELLRELTKMSYDTLASPRNDWVLHAPEPVDEEYWLQQAITDNLELLASRVALNLATHDVRTQRANRYPTLNVGATYTNSNAYDDTDFHEADNSWRQSLSLTITVPIFSGGNVSSQIRQNVYAQRAARERLERTMRETERSARDAFLGVQSTISLVAANKESMESARLALQATEAGFDVGTRTTIDVLNSRRQLQSAETDYLQSRYQYIQSVITLKQVAGKLAVSDLEEISSWLAQ